MIFVSLFLTILLSLGSMHQIHGSEISQAEQAFRTRYQHLKIPSFTHNPDPYSYNDGTQEVAIHNVYNLGDTLCNWIEGKTNTQDALKALFTYKAPRNLPTINTENDIHHFKLLHEMGHYDLSQKGFTFLNKQRLIISSALLNMYTWGIHRSKPYKNIFTKLCSKSIATGTLACAINIAWERFHENYADNYACKQVLDVKSIQKAAQEMEDRTQQGKSALEQLFKQNKIPLELIKPFVGIVGFLNDPYHPSDPSRLKKFQATIATRFPTT